MGGGKCYGMLLLVVRISRYYPPVESPGRMTSEDVHIALRRLGTQLQNINTKHEAKQLKFAQNILIRIQERCVWVNDSGVWKVVDTSALN